MEVRYICSTWCDDLRLYKNVMYELRVNVECNLK